MKNPWKIHEKSAMFSKIHEKSMKNPNDVPENPWKIHEKSISIFQMFWKIHEKSKIPLWKVLKNPWKIHEKSTKNPWKIHEKSTWSSVAQQDIEPFRFVLVSLNNSFSFLIEQLPCPFACRPTRFVSALLAKLLCKWRMHSQTLETRLALWMYCVPEFCARNSNGL